MGRPSDFKEEYCEQLVQHMQEGGSFETFAANVGCHRDTLYEWAKVHENFSDAKKRGVELSYKFYEGLAKAMAAGQLKRKVEHVNKHGEKVTTFEPTHGSASMLIFIMKNRFSWRDKIEHSGVGGGPIAMQFENMPDSEKRERLKNLLGKLNKRQEVIDDIEKVEKK